MIQAKSLIDCDVVIVNFNAGKLLINCVISALESGANRTIVVDNASTDNSIEALLKFSINSDNLCVIYNSQNLGFATGCNIGIKKTTASTILFLNPDSTLGEFAFSKMNEVLISSEKHGMVGGLLCNPDGSEQPGGRRLIPTPERTVLRLFGLSKFEQYFPTSLKDFSLHKETLSMKVSEIEAISGACMMVKREAIEDVGLWDEGYFLHCEDLDWCMRFKLKAWKVMFVPDAKITHAAGTCSRNRPIFVEWHKHKGMMRFYKKFFRHEYPGFMMWLVSLGVWLRFSLITVYYSVRQAGKWIGR